MLLLTSQNRWSPSAKMFILLTKNRGSLVLTVSTTLRVLHAVFPWCRTPGVLCGLRCTYCISPAQCPWQKAYKQTTNRLIVAVTEKQIAICGADSFKARQTRFFFFLAWLVNVLCFMDVCESPWTGRPPPQRPHPWSTGCGPQAWPRGSHRSGCTESQPSAGAPGIHQPPGPQGGLEETHTHKNP